MSNVDTGRTKSGLDGAIAAVLRRWEHHTGPIREWRSLYYKGTVLAIIAASGARYVLKEVAKGQPLERRLERLAAEHRLLLYLNDRGVPVPAPLTADNGRTYVRHPEGGAAVYTLHPLLPNWGTRSTGGGPAVPTWEQAEVWTNVGAAIGRLHRALAAYSGEIVSWHMALPERIRENALPAARAHLSGQQRATVDAVFDGLTNHVCAALADLPEQYIHGDCHGGNLLIADGEVSGFVDLDHLPLGPRVYDLFYLMADRIKERAYEPGWLVNRMGLLPHLLAGYEREIRLTPRERASLWPGMLATQLFFIQSFAEKGNQEHVVRNLRALTWIHEHRDDIQRSLGEQRDDGSARAEQQGSVP
jgi:Ser/Thr protein kinase RdoA (MazF antagonist)